MQMELHQLKEQALKLVAKEVSSPYPKHPVRHQV